LTQGVTNKKDGAKGRERKSAFHRVTNVVHKILSVPPAACALLRSQSDAVVLVMAAFAEGLSTDSARRKME
jgi:hypothetical protein